MKIKFENSGEVPLDKYPVGTIILEKFNGRSDAYFTYIVVKVDGELYLVDQFDDLYCQKDTKLFDEWVALEVGE